jgi:hypothetical protein
MAELGRPPWGLKPKQSSDYAQGIHLWAAIMPEETIKPPSRLQVNWPAFAVGLGLLATLMWMVFLGWLLGRVVRLIP